VNGQGKGVRLRDVGKVVERMTPPTIERKNRERIITVTAVAAPGAALSDIVASARAELGQWYTFRCRLGSCRNI
jgi:HAE1 family hydrophobic/amphiphilic exporter-1